MTLRRERQQGQERRKARVQQIRQHANAHPSLSLSLSVSPPCASLRPCRLLTDKEGPENM